MLDMHVVTPGPYTPEPPDIAYMAKMYNLGEAGASEPMSIGWKISFVFGAALIAGLSWYRSRLSHR